MIITTATHCCPPSTLHPTPCRTQAASWPLAQSAPSEVFAMHIFHPERILLCSLPSSTSIFNFSLRTAFWGRPVLNTEAKLCISSTTIMADLLTKLNCEHKFNAWMNVCILSRQIGLVPSSPLQSTVTDAYEIFSLVINKYLQVRFKLMFWMCPAFEMDELIWGDIWKMLNYK